MPEKKADNKRLKIINIYPLFEYFFLKCLLNRAIKTDSIQNPKNIYALSLLIDQFSITLNKEITAITQYIISEIRKFFIVQLY